MTSGLTNRLAGIRAQRGIAVADLARRVQVTRQTIYAIEAGTYVPNTQVALKLARELETTVDELFALPPADSPAPRYLNADVLSSQPLLPGQPVRACQIGSRWVGVPVTAGPCYLPEADGIAGPLARGRNRTALSLFAPEDKAQKRLVLAGCDPATGLLARTVEKTSGVEVISAPASSKLALQWLSEGKVHIAGCHLEDAKTGEFNIPFIRRHFPREDFSVITFAQWEEGFVVAPGNPKALRNVEDLARPGVSFINREPGSGSRALLDKLLKQAGIGDKSIAGYNRIAFGHLAAAWSVFSTDADACLATRSAAQIFGLGFIPLRTERYDFVLRKKSTEIPVIQEFLNVLQLAGLRRKLETLAGYDTSATGRLVA